MNCRRDLCRDLRRSLLRGSIATAITIAITISSSPALSATNHLSQSVNGGGDWSTNASYRSFLSLGVGEATGIATNTSNTAEQGFAFTTLEGDPPPYAATNYVWDGNGDSDNSGPWSDPDFWDLDDSYPGENGTNDTAELPICGVNRYVTNDVSTILKELILASDTQNYLSLGASLTAATISGGNGGRIDVNGQTLTFSSCTGLPRIEGDGLVVKEGTAMVATSQTQPFTGAWRLDEGIFFFSVGNMSASTSLTVNAGATFRFRSYVPPQKLMLNGDGYSTQGALHYMGAVDYTVSSAVTVETDSLARNTSASRTITLDGKVSGPGTLRLQGNWTFGHPQSGFAGSLVIESGTVQVPGAFLNATNITVQSGATLVGGQSHFPNANVVVEGGGTWNSDAAIGTWSGNGDSDNSGNWSDTNNWSGYVVPTNLALLPEVSSGSRTVTVDAAAFTDELQWPGTTGGGTDVVRLDASLTVGTWDGFTATPHYPDLVVNGHTVTVTEACAYRDFCYPEGNGLIVKQGTWEWQIDHMGATPTYTGGWRVEAGTLYLRSQHRLWNSSLITVADGATVRIDGAMNCPGFSLSGVGQNTTGALYSGSSFTSLGGLAIPSDAMANVAGTITIQGTVGGPGDLSLAGGGTLALDGDWVFDIGGSDANAIVVTNGSVDISGCTLVITNAGAATADEYVILDYSAATGTKIGAFTATNGLSAEWRVDADGTVANPDCVVLVSERTIYVDDTATGANSGTSWADAFTNIQAGVDDAYDGDLVLVSNGWYVVGGRPASGGVLTNRVTIDKNITVRSEGGPDQTFIVGTGPMGSNAVRCAYVAANAVLSGFTLTNGYTLPGSGFTLDKVGGGAFCEPGGVLSNCLVTCNNAGWGGGVWSGTVYNCTIVTNTASYQGGGVHGGHLYDCAISNNNSGTDGGGARSAELHRCVVQNNHSATSGGGLSWCFPAHSCLIIDNSADLYAGGVLNGWIRNCTIADNTTGGGGGGAVEGWFTNCIVYHNTGAAGFANYSNVTFAFSCTTPLPGGQGNITNAPEFSDRVGGNYRLAPGSPCVNTGTNHPWMSGAKDLDGNARIAAGIPDIGAYEATVAAPSVTNTPATAISGSTAVLNGELLSDGYAATLVVLYWGMVDGGTNADLWANTNVLGFLAVGAFSTNVTGLTANTTYRYRCRASNELTSTWAASSTEFSTHLADNIILVDADAAGNDDGGTWSDAFTDLQSAIATASNGDEIWVAEGTYIPGTDASTFFQLKTDVALYGGFDGTETSRGERDWAAHETVLSGYLGPGTNSYRITRKTTGGQSVMDGFTVRDGDGTGGAYHGAGIQCNTGELLLFNCTFTSNACTGSGGAVYFGASAYGTISNCLFTGNSAASALGYGGAVRQEGTLFPLTILASHFEGNFATRSGGAVSTRGTTNVFADCVFVDNRSTNNYPGGAVELAEGENRLVGCAFTNNRAVKSNGGAVFFVSIDSLLVSNCVFSANAASGAGGAIYAANSPYAWDMANCWFVENTASNGSGAACYVRGQKFTFMNTRFIDNTSLGHGGAVYAFDTQDSNLVANCLFAGNEVLSVAARGGGLYADLNDPGRSLRLENCTFTTNSAGRGGAICLYEGVLGVTNCIFRDDVAVASGRNEINVNSTASTMYLAHCAIDTNEIELIGGVLFLGPGTTNADPLFVDIETHDYRLRPGSPCIDTGTNLSWSAAGTDLDGNARILGPSVDMGALEYDTNDFPQLIIEGQPDRYDSPTPQGYGTNTHENGTVITNSVTSPADETNGQRWVCRGWEGTGSVPATGPSNAVVFTITNDSTLTWLWTNEYELVVSAGTGGSVNSGAVNGWYTNGLTATNITATPATGFHFVTWSGDYSGTENPLSLSMTQAWSLVAHFTNHPPVVTNVVIAQRAGTKLVDITYDVSDDDGDPVTISVAISTNGGLAYDLPATSFSGPGYGVGIAPGTNLSIVWDAGADWDAQYTTNLRAEVTADDTPTNFPGEMSMIPAGSFEMGQPIYGPRTITVSTFLMERYEVTEQLWQEVHTWATNNGYDLTATGLPTNAPMTNVSWYAALKWCNARSEKEGFTPVYYTDTAQTAAYRTGATNLQNANVKWSANGYRLPTDAEWEKAARGHTLVSADYPWGAGINGTRANYLGSGDAYEPGRTPVGYYPAYGYSMRDMAGNAKEWCWDLYMGAPPSHGSVDPRGPDGGGPRLARSGSWSQGAPTLRCAYRDSEPPGMRTDYLGLRCVRRP